MRLAWHKKYGRQLDPKARGDRVSLRRFANYCPLLIESDLLSLSQGLRIGGQHLHDKSLGAAHLVQPEGQVLLAKLESGEVTYASLLQSSKYTNELLGFLNMIGGLRRRRSARGWIAAVGRSANLLALIETHTSLAWRRPTSAYCLLVALLRASWPVIAGAGGVYILAVGGGIIKGSVAAPLLLFANLTFIVSLYAHEAAHLFVLRLHKAHTEIIQRGLRLGILHRKLSPEVELHSAVAGPLAGCMSCLATSLAMFTTRHNSYTLVAALLAAFHLLSFLPWYGDGESLARAWREVRE